MKKNKLTFIILVLLIVSDILETFTHFCFKKGALTVQNFTISNLPDALYFLQNIFSSYFVWIGLLSVVSTFIIWSTVLSKINLSMAVPIASFSYILIPLTSVILLHEKIGAVRWIGIFLILIGVIFVSLDGRKDE